MKGKSFKSTKTGNPPDDSMYLNSPHKEARNYIEALLQLDNF